MKSHPWRCAQRRVYMRANNSFYVAHLQLAHPTRQPGGDTLDGMDRIADVRVLQVVQPSYNPEEDNEWSLFLALGVSGV